MKLIFSVFAICVGLLFGCATGAGDIGKDFDDSYVPKIQKNVTTKAEIRQHFGEPASVSTSTAGEIWTYQYTNAYATSYMKMSTYGLVNEKTINKQLFVIFSGDRVLEYQYTK